MSHFFFESAEPQLDKVSLETCLGRFPEGMYEFGTQTLDGLEHDGETLFTHVIPEGPIITSPAGHEVVDAADPLTITWDAVIQAAAINPPQQSCSTTEATPCTIGGWQVIVTKAADG